MTDNRNETYSDGENQLSQRQIDIIMLVVWIFFTVFITSAVAFFIYAGIDTIGAVVKSSNIFFIFAGINGILDIIVIISLISHIRKMLTVKKIKNKFFPDDGGDL